MRKLWSVVLVVMFAAAFAACGDDNGTDNTGKIGYACFTDGTCDEGECVADICTDCTAGDQGCVCLADDLCNGDLACVDGICSLASDCCPGQEGFITVDGAAINLADAPNGVDGAALAALAPASALTGDLATHLAETTSGTGGVFHFDCFDVSNVALGLVILADDAGFDGTGGDWFPTITGIAGYATAADKVCEENAQAMMIVNNPLQGAINQIPGIDAVTVGYVIGSVVDAAHQPLEGATVARADGEALTVVYPAADFTAFDLTATSATGIYIIPTQLTLTSLIGVKEGYTWDEELFKAATVPGAAYFVPLVANE